MQLDDWVLCRIYKKTSQVSPMPVPPLSDHELDEPSGAYPMSSAGMLVQAGTSSYPLQGTAAGTQRMPKIPSISELLNDYSLAQLFNDGGHGEMPRHDQHGAALLGHPYHEPIPFEQQHVPVCADGLVGVHVDGRPGRCREAQEIVGGLWL
jgi:hypothetical protein